VHIRHPVLQSPPMKGPLQIFSAFSLAALLAAGCHKKTTTASTPEDAAKPAAMVAGKPAPDSHEPSLRPLAPGETPETKPAGAKPDASSSGDLAAANPDYVAWFKKYHLDLNDPKMLDADPDGDGYTNREEFLAGTNPLDPNSHPASHGDSSTDVHKTIRLKEFTEVQVPFILKSVDGESAKIEHTDEGSGKAEEVRVGQKLRNSTLKVEKIQARRGVDKEGAAVDASLVTLQDPATKEQTILVKDLPTRSPATFAVLSSPDGVTTMNVRRGDTFSWPGEKNVTYKVVDLGSSQVVLQEVESGKMWTVPKR
jgi:Bacterial TSP3 repeat